MQEIRAGAKLVILETSDVHGSIFPINYGTNENVPQGLSYAATVIKKHRKQEGNLLVIDNGDLIQGTPLAYHFVKFGAALPNPMIKVLNELEYDAAVIGNHEFNYGMEILNRAVSESDFPWLSANIVDSSTRTPKFGTPYMVKKFDSGVKAAVLGLTTHYIPNWENPKHIKELKFEDALETAKKWVNYIHEKEKPDILILAYHGGFERDLETGRETENQTGENQAYRICHEVEGIDLLLTGHQHRKIAGELQGVTVLQPGFNGKQIGKATISFVKDNGRWKIADKVAEIMELENEEPDESILTLVEKYEQETQNWLDQTLGTIVGNMEVTDPIDLRTNEHPLIEFINKVQMEASGAAISNTALFHNEAPGFSKQVTMREIVSNYVYPNTLSVIKISGQDMKDALERSASYFIVDNGKIAVNPNFSEPKPQHYNYDMWEGIDYILDIRKPVGERVVKLSHKGHDVKPEEEFEVVMNNYRAGGGGDYTMFKNKTVIKEIQTDMTELLANYFLEHNTIKATVNHNWKVIW
ncbi:bifunctional metallophosphatase/5'-nucleotidase [Mesobacillus jeotgali]|uniref:bifunctional metallophosphatase/5'-nucleotidase n=1 Tax=Mesobacillus jeotgali TaxID=129985 RepID=UPI001CFF234A|nr:bifunctional UDP-sugar hydrolase/5'-nucleotidase [Mesobacillus jeotgali]